MRLRFGKKGKEEEIRDFAVEPKMTIEALRRKVGERIGLHWSRVELRGSDPADKAAETVKYTGEVRTLDSFGTKLTDVTAVVWVKDLGMQFSYRGVFLIEYAMPIVLMLLLSLRPAFLFGAAAGPLPLLATLLPQLFAPLPSEGSAQWTLLVQCLAVALYVLHFAKRELETLFVHKFSRPYMPIFNLFKNCGYYWGFAVLVGYPLVHPSYTAPGAAQVALGGALWCASQLTNLAVHCQLAGMRGGDGDDAREPPQGLLFSLVTSPNYTSEVLAWVGWSLLCNVAMGYLFAVGGFVQMLQWALQKYNGYKKDKKGKEYTKGRKAIVPFVI